MTNLISWVEIPAKDFNRATEFYNELLNIDLQINDFGEEKMACFPNGEGAVSFAPDFEPGRNGLLVSFFTKNIDEAIKKAESMGGEIIKQKTKIEAESRGYFALVIDSEGNKIGLYSE